MVSVKIYVRVWLAIEDREWITIQKTSHLYFLISPSIFTLLISSGASLSIAIGMTPVTPELECEVVVYENFPFFDEYVNLFGIALG